MPKKKGKSKRSHPDEESNGNGDAKVAKNGLSGDDGCPLHLSNGVSAATEKLKSCWKSVSAVEEEDGLLLTSEPFQCCAVKDFLSPDSDLDALEAELSDLDFAEKDNDLYKFLQTPFDLKSVDTPLVGALHRLLRDRVRPWLEDVTGAPLDPDCVDMFCARYSNTDYLACHDDELEGRRIAYIFYLVPTSWDSSDGGALDLFDVDGDGHPDKVVRSVLPSRNSFAFFEVTHKSFHQVAEVLSRDKVRVSVGGWFHGPPTGPRPPRAPLPAPSSRPLVDLTEEEFYSWVNPVYLEASNQVEIRERFEESSEISLPEFLKPEMHQQVRQCLRELETGWTKTGPADKRSYDCRKEDDEDLPEVARRCADFLRSDALALLLSNLTGLRLHPLAPEAEDSDEDDGDKGPKPGTSKAKEEDEEKGEPACRCEVRRWRPGYYTLMRDDDGSTSSSEAAESKFRLDARLFLNVPERWGPEMGGHTSYVARDADEELLSAQPEEGALALVYRDEAETLGFVKRCNSLMAGGDGFHDFAMVYYEV